MRKTTQIMGNKNPVLCKLLHKIITFVYTSYYFIICGKMVEITTQRY